MIALRLCMVVAVDVAGTRKVVVVGLRCLVVVPAVSGVIVVVVVVYC